MRAFKSSREICSLRSARSLSVRVQIFCKTSGVPGANVVTVSALVLPDRIFGNIFRDTAVGYVIAEIFPGKTGINGIFGFFHACL